MSEIDELKKVFSDNLKYYLNNSKLTQVDLTNYMGVSCSTSSDWCNGKKLPRMDKIQKICEWLHITRDDLLEERSSNVSKESLTPFEKRLLDLFNEMNNDGQGMLVEYAEYLCGNSRYKK